MWLRYSKPLPAAVLGGFKPAAISTSCRATAAEKSLTPVAPYFLRRLCVALVLFRVLTNSLTASTGIRSAYLGFRPEVNIAENASCGTWATENKGYKTTELRSMFANQEKNLMLGMATLLMDEKASMYRGSATSYNSCTPLRNTRTMFFPGSSLSTLVTIFRSPAWISLPMSIICKALWFLTLRLIAYCVQRTMLSKTS